MLETAASWVLLPNPVGHTQRGNDAERPGGFTTSKGCALLTDLVAKRLKLSDWFVKWSRHI